MVSNDFERITKYKKVRNIGVSDFSKVDGNKLYTINYNRGNERLKFETGSATATIRKAMPEITMARVSNNRVFGIDAAVSDAVSDVKKWANDRFQTGVE